MHAHRDAMNLSELRTIFAKSLWRKRLNFRFAVGDAVSRIGVIAQKLWSLTAFRLDLFEESWKLDGIVASRRIQRI